MVDLYLISMFWTLYVVVFAKDIEAGQPKNDDNGMTNANFITIEELFGDTQILSKSQLVANGQKLDLTVTTISLMIDKAIEDATVDIFAYESRPTDIFYELQKLPY